VKDPAQIASVRHAETEGNPRQAGNTVVVELKPDFEVDSERFRRKFYATSSCGKA